MKSTTKSSLETNGDNANTWMVNTPSKQNQLTNLNNYIARAKQGNLEPLAALSKALTAIS